MCNQFGRWLVTSGQIVIRAAAIFLLACSGRARLPLGQLPVAVAPEIDSLNESKLIIEANLAQEGYKLIDSPAEHERVNKIISKIAWAAGATNFAYPVYIVDAGSEVNAMAINNNSILVYRELFNRVGSDDELAAIIGHEIGHILAQHTDEEIVLESADETPPALAVDSLGDIVFLAEGGSTFVRAYNRDTELEADEIGLILMAKAGYNPQAALDIWSRAEAVFGLAGGTGSIGTHPAYADRLRALAEALPVALKFYEAAAVQSAHLAGVVETTMGPSQQQVKR